jgi:hypothetical protein
MMYSLALDVIPVDVHARRIAVRLGALPKDTDHPTAQVRLPGYIPDGRSKDLHVGFVDAGSVGLESRFAAHAPYKIFAGLGNGSYDASRRSTPGNYAGHSAVS